MVVEDIKNNDKIEIGVFYELKPGMIMFEGSILTEIPTALLDNYRRDARGIPHTALWNYLSPGVKVSWDIFDIIGGCSHIEAMGENIICILNHEYSNYINGNASQILPPDQRFR